MITRRERQMHSVRAFMRGGKKQVRSTELSSSLPQSVRRFATHTLEPGASIGYHVHRGETEVVYILDGMGTVQDDDRTCDIFACDSFITPSGHGHALENTGDRDLVLLSVIIRDPV